MRLDLFSLHLLADVIEAGSINQGARQNHLAVSAASKRITDLEAVFRTRLLHRHPRGVTATIAGKALHARIRQTLGDLQQLVAEMGEFAEGIRGEVRIFSNLTAMIHRLPEDLAGFVDHYPTVRVDLEERSTTDTLVELQRSRAEIGIVAPVCAYPPELRFWEYDAVRHVLVMHPDHPLAGRTSVTFAETLHHDYIGLEVGGGWDVLLNQLGKEMGSPVRIRVRVNGFEAACRMAQARLGLAIVPTSTASLHAGPLGLRMVSLDEFWATVPLHICSRDMDALPAAARTLVKHLTAGRSLPSPSVTAWWRTRMGVLAA